MQQIKFTIETPYGTYTDSIVYPDHQVWTDEEIETEKQQRVDNWMRTCFPFDFPSEST